MNLSDLQILLQKSVSDATQTVDYLLLAKAIQSLKIGQIRMASTFANLPSAVGNEGLVVFVEADELLYYSTGTKWNTIAATDSSSIWAWGNNISGHLGDGTTTAKSSPVSVVGGFTDWCQVSAGLSHSLGVRTNGSLWAWGSTGAGQLGNGTNTDQSSPVSVIGGFTDWCQVSAGATHSLGVRTNGTLWAWGSNYLGRLGDGTSVPKSSPVSVIGGFTDWCQASAGWYHSIGVRANGTVWAWGANYYGSLGDGTTVSKLSPVSVIGGFTDWCQVSAGSYHSLGIRTNGSLWAWGSNSGGRLGDGTLTARSSPVSVIGGFTGWCQVSAGNAHSLGVRANGTAWAWGCNVQGRLGDGTTIDKSSPVSVIGGFTDWCRVSAGYAHTIGIRTNGSLWAWGSNTSGQLGDGTITNQSSPVSVVGGFTDWCQASAGFAQSIGIRSIFT